MVKNLLASAGDARDEGLISGLLFHVQFYCCFLTCIQISQEADQVVGIPIS